MYWSLSEFLNTFEFRSQSWCVVAMGVDQAIRTPHAEAAFFYALLEGQARIAGVGGQEIELRQGDIAMVFSGEAHTLRVQAGSRPKVVSLLQGSGYIDTPPLITVGAGPVGAKLLCGRLKVRWPTGQRPRGMPPQLTIRADKVLFGAEQLLALAQDEGGSAVLTHLANLQFVTAFRDTPDCRALFCSSDLWDPIARARQCIEKHPFQGWTVAALASKVGMSRSSFAARFVIQTGKTPMDVLAEERMKMAAALLERSDLKIAEVCERVGYRSEAAFHHRFTSHFGISPGSFRRSSRSAAE